MTIYGFIFYLLSILIVVTTGLAITRRNMVHAVVYLVISFFGSAMLFYLLGAPLLAALEVIIYAGAIMILFLFIVMMLRIEGMEEQFLPLRQWVPAAVICLGYLIVFGMVVFSDVGESESLKPAVAQPAKFGVFLFRNHWLSIEIVSLLLLIALVGALHLGRRNGGNGGKPEDTGK